MEVVGDCLRQGGTRHLVDVYCGVGFFSLELGDLVESFVGVELDRLAIQAARRNAAARGRANGEFVAGARRNSCRALLSRFTAAATTVSAGPAAQGLPARDVANAAPGAAGADHLRLLPPGDDGAGLERFVRRTVSLSWRKWSRWTCFRRPSTWNAWRIYAARWRRLVRN